MNNKTTYYRKNRENILTRAKKYYENNKERFREYIENYLRKKKI